MAIDDFGNALREEERKRKKKGPLPTKNEERKSPATMTEGAQISGPYAGMSAFLTAAILGAREINVLQKVGMKEGRT